jgi:MFS family permease
MIFAAPLAGRLAKGIPAHLIALAGTGLSSLGLLGIAVVSGGWGLGWLVVAMMAQGFGVGLFQVAYFEIITGAIPARNRGVAGALGMATRSIGTVTGATVLMLIFQMMQASHDFGPAFQGTFAAAGGLAAVTLLLQVMRPAIKAPSNLL